MKKRIITAVIVMCMTVVSMTGCMREADRVTYNVQKEADNFNVERRLSVINARTDKPVLELIGYFSLSNNDNNELVIIGNRAEHIQGKLCLLERLDDLHSGRYQRRTCGQVSL